MFARGHRLRGCSDLGNQWATRELSVAYRPDHRCENGRASCWIVSGLCSAVSWSLVRSRLGENKACFYKLTTNDSNAVLILDVDWLESDTNEFRHGVSRAKINRREVSCESGRDSCE
jgi:hypothetical protein